MTAARAAIRIGTLAFPGYLCVYYLKLENMSSFWLKFISTRKGEAMVAHRSRRLVAASLLAALYSVAPEEAHAQPRTSTVSSPIALTTEERLKVEQIVVDEPRVRAIIGQGQPRVVTSGVEVDKAEAEAFLTGRTNTPPTRRVTVLLINPQTQQAAKALIEPSQNRVLSVESVAAVDVPFLRGDADRALALAKADPNVRRAVGDTLDRYEILDSGSDARVAYAAQALPLRSSDPRDVCSVDRCLDLIFRTESGYLPLRAHVNLTRGTVEVHSGGGQHR